MEVSKFSKHFEFDLGRCNILASLVNVHDRQPLRSPSLLSSPAPQPVLRTVLTPCTGITFGRLHQRNYPLTPSVLLLTH